MRNVDLGFEAASWKFGDNPGWGGRQKCEVVLQCGNLIPHDFAIEPFKVRSHVWLTFAGAKVRLMTVTVANHKISNDTGKITSAHIRGYCELSTSAIGRRRNLVQGAVWLRAYGYQWGAVARILATSVSKSKKLHDCSAAPWREFDIKNPVLVEPHSGSAGAWSVSEDSNAIVWKGRDGLGKESVVCRAPNETTKAQSARWKSDSELICRAQTMDRALQEILVLSGRYTDFHGQVKNALYRHGLIHPA